MALLPDAHVPRGDGRGQVDGLRGELGRGGFLDVGGAEQHVRVGEVLVGGHFDLDALERVQRVLIPIAVQVDGVYLSRLAEIILQVYVVPAGVSVVFRAAVLFSGDDFGDVAVGRVESGVAVGGGGRVLDQHVRRGGVAVADQMRAVGRGQFAGKYIACGGFGGHRDCGCSRNGQRACGGYGRDTAE